MQLFYGTCLLFLMIIIELFIIRRFEKQLPWREIVTNLNSGHIVLWIFRGVEVIVYTYCFRHLSLRLLEGVNIFIIWILTFIAWDFCFYWLHRIHHHVSIFWKVHQVHHQGEHFSLSLGIRNSWYSSLTSIPFFLPLAFLGVPVEIFVTVAAIHYFIQFYNHNRIVRNSGWLDYFFITPSHHRVHHGIDDVYVNKNFGGTFVFWDKYFGTFQKESSAIPEVYGLKDYSFDEDIFKINIDPFIKYPDRNEGVDSTKRPILHDVQIVVTTFLLFLLLLIFIKNEAVWPFNQSLLLFFTVTTGTILLGKINSGNIYLIILNFLISSVFPIVFIILYDINALEIAIQSLYGFYSIINTLIIFNKWRK